MARVTRPPIVAVMGHIDHGKSSLLDYIRKTTVTASEAGGITQHVSAYESEHEHEGKMRKITFLDTPGHEAFRALRARGAAAADVAILVVAADEGVKPQTLEALGAITEAQTPFVVALTKMDKNNADVEKAKLSLVENGVYLEGLGGEVPYHAVSSKSGAGVPELLDLVLLTADLAELTADEDALATGFVLESSQDPRQGLSATLVVKDGTLDAGSVVVAGLAYAPVRFIEDFAGKRIKAALPSQPARISGFSELPPAGTPFRTFKNKKEAEAAIAIVSSALDTAGPAAAEMEEGKAILPLVIKSDVTGSLEAIKHELAKLSHEGAQLRILSTGIGRVGEADVKTAIAANGGRIIAFTVDVDAPARDLAERSGIPIESFSIIYDLGKRVSDLLAEAAPKVARDEVLGEAMVLKVFSEGNNKQVLGARLTSGEFKVGAQVKVTRAGEELGRGKIANLQQARADVEVLRVEGDFGMQLETKVALTYGDLLTAFRRVEAP